MSALALLGVAPHDPDDASVHYLFDAFVAATTARPGRLRFASRRYWIGRRARTDLLALFARRRHAPNGGVLPALVGVFDGAGHSAGEVGDHLLALMIAARETTASLITWLLIELASDGTLAERCRSEVRNARSDPGLLARRGGAPTLGAVLAETERLHSPNIISVRRARRDVHLDGFALRAGCRVAYSPAANHLDPVAYPDPYAFRPDRFADGGRARAASLLTFGGGVHACLGRPLAELMTLTAAAAVLRRGRPFLPAGLPGPVRYLPAKAPARPLPFRLDPIGAAR
jgi:cytochrome P450